MIKEKDIKRLSRRDLLEILVLQSKKIDELTDKLDRVNKELEDKHIMIAEAGTLADASLKLNKVIERAQEAADQYLANVKRMAGVEDNINLLVKERE